MDFVITLDRDSAIPLYAQVAEEIRQAILQGRLKPEQKLPSSRTLAESLGISRITVTQCYDQLTGEGYLETSKGRVLMFVLNYPMNGYQIEQKNNFYRTTIGFYLLCLIMDVA